MTLKTFMNIHIRLLAFFLMVIGTSLHTSAQHVSVTVAGSGRRGYYGDGGLARMAKLNRNTQICVDANQNVYFSDQTSRVIRKISGKDGTITTIAGGGSSTSDGIPATNATLFVQGLCTDPAGNIYVLSGNIKRIDATTNIITTYAGGGTSTAEGIPATAALISAASICSDNTGNIYLTTNHRVRKIDGSTYTISTVAGSGLSGYSGDGGPALLANLNIPGYIAADDTGNIYFSDVYATGINRIRRIHHSTGTISTVIGATTTSAPVEYCLGLDLGVGPISGLTCDRDGCVVISETSCSCRKWSPATDTVYPLAGNFTIESFDDDTTSIYAYMNTNHGVCVDNENNYYVADTANRRVRKIIPLSTKPKFAFGNGQYITPCPGGGGHRLDSLLWIADIDLAQIETWTIASTPTHGSLSGFPVTAPSKGRFKTTKPLDLFYTPDASYMGEDFFKVKVSDGSSSDTLTIYVSVQPPPSIAITTPDSICTGTMLSVSTSVEGGSWGSINGYVAVGANDSITATLASVSGGFDTVTYSVNFGCITTAKNAIRINPSLSSAVVWGPDTICVGETALFSSPMSGGTWTTTNYAVSIIDLSSGVCNGILPGINYVQYNVSNECGAATNSKTLVVKDCGTTNTEPVKETGVPPYSIFPNPASEKLSVKLNGPVKNPAKLIILNALGQEMMNTDLEIKATTYSIDITSLPPGAYLATFKSAESFSTQKFNVVK